MPLKRMLEEGRSFGPKAVALLLEAFDGIVAELDLRSDREYDGETFTRHDNLSIFAMARTARLK